MSKYFLDVIILFYTNIQLIIVIIINVLCCFGILFGLVMFFTVGYEVEWLYRSLLFLTIFIGIAVFQILMHYNARPLPEEIKKDDAHTNSK